MLSLSSLRLRACVVAALLLVVTAVPTTQNADLPARYTALAVNLGDTPVRWTTKTVEMVVNRWSTAAARDRLVSVLMEKGPDKLLEALRKSPRVGYIRTPDSIGYDVRFAQHLQGEDGGERVVLVTDRYISFWEQVNRPRTFDYPFTVIDLRIGPNGEGTGKMSLFAKIAVDKKDNTIIIEDYGTQPVLLQGLKKQAKTD
jgi:hypothetical protein